MVSENLALKAALSYARRGFAVFPLRSKRPITPEGFKDASSSPEMIRAWWGEHPEYGVGIRIPEWAIVVDVDAGGKKSLAAFSHDLPDTPTARTRNGSHHWYELPEGVDPHAATRRIKHIPGIDLLVNGYVVAPPSPHPLGGCYEWEDGTPKLLRENCETAPDWVVVAVTEDKAHSDGMSDDDFVNGLPVGQRQQGLFRRACRLRNMGNSKGEAKAILRDLAQRSGSADYNTDALVDRVWKTYDEGKTKADDHKVITPKVISLQDHLQIATEPPLHLISELLPGVGYTLFSAPQKVGKSCFAAQCALAVATGSKIFGLEVERCGVLYLDLEQDGAGAADRWRKLLLGNGMETVPGNIHLAFEWPPVDQGGLEKLGAFLVDHPHVRLVVVDVLSDLWPEDEGGASNAYNRESRIMRWFNTFSKEYDTALLVVHHDRKGQGGKDNFSDRASGTRAIAGKAKAVWNLQRDDAGLGVLETTGKNIPQRKIHLTFDDAHLMWR